MFDQQRHVVAVLDPVLRRHLDAGMARHRRPGAAARWSSRRSRQFTFDRVEESRRASGCSTGAGPRTPSRRCARPVSIGHLPALAVRRRNRRAAGQRHAERLGDGVHRRCRAHRVAVAERRRGSQARRPGTPPRRSRRPPACRRARQITVPEPTSSPSCQPSSIGPPDEHDGGNVDRRGRHHRRRRGLVAAGGQHHGVDRIAVQDLDQAEIGQVAVERRRRPPAILEDRVQREFHRDAARVADAVAYAAAPAPGGCGCTASRSLPVCAMPMIGLPERSSSGVMP